ncbi:WXG100 family type VII secretion target [Streptomyces sp. NPDC054765]
MVTNGTGNATAGGVTYRVTPEYLAHAAASCQSTASDIDTILAQIKTYVVNLESVWQGIAHNQFQALMADYDTYGRMLHEALTGIGSGLHGNYVNYVDSEQTNINSLVAVNGSIPGKSTLANFS